MEYSSKQIAEAVGLTPATIREICLRKRLPKKKNYYTFCIDVWREVLLKKHHKKLYKLEPYRNKNKRFPEIIYVTRTTEIYESNLKNLDFAECEKSISQSKLNYINL